MYSSLLFVIMLHTYTTVNKQYKIILGELRATILGKIKEEVVQHTKTK